MQRETPYGIRKRLMFFSSVIEQLRPSSVLEMGCGTGTQVAQPLAELYPSVSFVGADSDPPTIEYARTHHVRSNLRFYTTDELPFDETFALIIASEVLEHVADPPHFLDTLTLRLAPAGKLLITVPNGYGPFEISAFAESLLHATGLTAIPRLVRRLFRNAQSTSFSVLSDSADTLANSPHVNFFRFSDLRRLLASTGLTISQYRGRTWVCGYGFDTFINSFRLSAMNALIADYLPPSFVSDWMLLVEPTPMPSHPPRQFTRNLYARLRRNLNLRRSRIPDDSIRRAS